MEVIGIAMLALGAASYIGGLTLDLTDGGTMARSSRYVSREMQRLGFGFTALGLIALCLGMLVP